MQSGKLSSDKTPRVRTTNGASTRKPIGTSRLRPQIWDAPNAKRHNYHWLLLNQQPRVPLIMAAHLLLDIALEATF